MAVALALDLFGGGQRRCGEVYTKAAAPDRHRLILTEVDVGGDCVILIPLVPFHSAEIDKPSPSHGFIVRRIFSSDQIDAYVRSVGRLEHGEAHKTFAIAQLMDGRHPTL